MGNKGKNIRSSLNQDSDTLKVFFKFALGEDIFEITRSYVKKLTKKNEEKFEQINPILKLNGDIIGDTITSVNSKISEHFGMAIGDFTRSVVLPQGKFSDFLRLKGSEKMAMLENIFDLEKYGTKLFEKIKYRNSILNEKLSALQNQIKGKGDISKEFISSLELDFLEKSKEFEELKSSRQIIENIYNKEKIVKELSEDLDKYENNLNILNLEEDKIIGFEKQLENHLNALKFKEQINSLKDLKSTLNSYMAELKKLISDFEKSKTLEKLLNDEKLSQIELSNRCSEELNDYKIDYNELSALREIIPHIKELEYREKELKKLISNSSDASLSLELNQSNLEKSKNNLESYLTDKKTLKKIDSNEIEESINELSTLKFELKLAKESLQKKIVLEQNLEELSISEKKQNLLLDELKEKLLLAETNNLKYLSFELSKNLKEGEACPVCGSHTHPNIASSFLEKDNYDLDDLRKKVHLASTDLFAIQHKITAMQDEKNSYQNIDIEALEENCRKKYKKITDLKAENESILLKEVSLNKSISFEENNIEHLNQNIWELSKKIEQNKAETLVLEKDILEIKRTIDTFNFTDVSLDFLEKKKNLLEELDSKSRKLLNYKIEIDNKVKDIENKISKVLDESQKYNLDIARLEEKINFLEKTILSDEKKLNEEIEKQGFSNIDSILNYILTDEDSKRLKLKIENHYSEKTKFKNLKDNVLSKLNGRSFDSFKWNEITEQLNTLKLSENSLNTKIASIKTTLDRVKILAEEAKQLLLEIEVLTKQQDNLIMLQKKIEGRKFVKFLSRRKLDYIVFLASERLKLITRGRYTLAIDNNCDFNIIDAFNGNFLRECNTLSGGETFIVSLVLALALSSQLQLKGKTQLEFFFLDEGFGTLDASLLEKVMQVLHGIKANENLKIGIISHVEDLKIQIPRRLEVIPAIPGEKGSTVKLI